MPHLTLVDASGFIFRAYHALPPLTSEKDGTPVGAVFGFCSMLLRLLKDHPTTHIAVVFDTARKTFRNDLFPEYKSHRPPPPDDLIPQFALVRQAVKAFDLPMIEKEGFEADDIIATLTQQARKRDWDVTLVSSDKDLMQLVQEGVDMLDTLKNRRITPTEVMEKFFVPPHQVLEVLALTGDTSDFIPGVPGIGVKTAAELINAYGSLEGIYENLSQIKQPKRQERLRDHQEMAFLSRRLVQLCETVPLDEGQTLDHLEQGPLPVETITAFFQELGFKTLMKRLSPSDEGTGDETAGDILDGATYYLVQSVADLEKLVHDCYINGRMAIDTETTGLDPFSARLVGISIAHTMGQAHYIPLTHRESASSGPLFPGKPLDGQISLEQVQRILGPLLCDPSVEKIGHNIKYDLHILSRAGLFVHTCQDTMVLSYVLFGSQHAHNLDFLAKHYLNHTMLSYKDVTAGGGKGEKTFDLVDLETACTYAGEDALATLALYQHFKPMLREMSLTHTYAAFDRPLISLLHAMEEKGICIDVPLLENLSKEMEGRLETLEKDIHHEAGESFNVASPKQLADILYTKMGFDPGKKGKSGQHSTSVDVLQELAQQGHAIASKILDWRHLAKLKSTYTDALVKVADPHTHRVHTTFAMTITNTGRLSSNHPNLQNIPIRTEEGRRIRQAFRGAPGWVLVSLDYSQIELRLLAHVTQDATLLEAFRHNQDIHQKTASQIFSIPLDAVTPTQRREAKAINFGIIYGMSPYGLSQHLGISRDQARQYIDAYFQTYPGIPKYMDEIKEQARTQGYVTTLWGRRCYVPGIRDKNPNTRNFAERQAINAPLQGTAADIVKAAMIRVKDLLATMPHEAHLLLQVHDELIFEVPEDQADSFIPPIRRAMESVASLSVPLKVEGGQGHTWQDAHG